MIVIFQILGGTYEKSSKTCRGYHANFIKLCGNTFDGENFQLKINAKRYDNNAMIISYEIGRNDYSRIVNLAKQEVSLDADYFQYNSAADDSFANYVLSNSKKHESRVTAVSLVCDKI
ncbi:hypothetical protein [Halobacteriovorax sp.]|uniref:hypothetical protein n=1 Tax=Halobacteriovorax sp. TaxID=2020862 RepID=UPI003AF1FECC